MMYRNRTRSLGFTLVELVMVIVILGILAAIVMPKFLSMGTDARKASLNATNGAIRSAAQNGFLRCQTQPSCSPTAASSTFTDNTLTYAVTYGYPDDTSSNGTNKSIKDLLDVSGFAAAAATGGGVEYQLTNSPDPANCKVTYKNATSSTVPYSTTIVDTGC